MSGILIQQQLYITSHFTGQPVESSLSPRPMHAVDSARRNWGWFYAMIFSSDAHAEAYILLDVLILEFMYELTAID